MEAYEGYYEDGRFYPVGQTITIKGRRRVRMTLVEEPVTEHQETAQAAAWREFFEAINASNEEVPETFERVNFAQEIAL